MKEREDVPVMLLGLKRDLRVEGAGVIYPQEVSCSDVLSVLFNLCDGEQREGVCGG